MFRLILAILFLIITVGFLPFKNIDGVNLRKLAIIPFGLFVLFLAWSSIRVVGVGEVGIPVVLGDAKEPLGNGVNIVNPIASVKMFSTRTEDYSMFGTEPGDDAGDDIQVTVKGKDGATGYVSSTTLYHLPEDEASNVFSTLGTNYEDKIIRPTVRACIRDEFSKFNMIDAATGARGNIDFAIASCIEKQIVKSGLILDEFQLRDVDVDPNVQQSIDAKVAAEQNAAQREFDLQTERTNQDIVRERAKGTADAEQIIVCGANTTTDDEGRVTLTPKEGAECENNLTPEYLELQRIQALEKFAENGNSLIPSDVLITRQAPQGAAEQ